MNIWGHRRQAWKRPQSKQNSFIDPSSALYLISSLSSPFHTYLSLPVSVSTVSCSYLIEKLDLKPFHHQDTQAVGNPLSTCYQFGDTSRVAGKLSHWSKGLVMGSAEAQVQSTGKSLTAPSLPCFKVCFRVQQEPYQRLLGKTCTFLLSHFRDLIREKEIKRAG